MANHKSALKCTRTSIKKKQVNMSRLSRIRSAIRRFNEAVASKDKQAATSAFQAMQPELMRGVQKNLFHINNVARQLSRANVRLKAL